MPYPLKENIKKRQNKNKNKNKNTDIIIFNDL